MPGPTHIQTIQGDLHIGSNLQVDTNTFFVDSVSNTVGIGTTIPGYALDVAGDINLSGDFYQGGSPFVSSLWTDGNDSLYYRSNVEVGTANLFVDTTTGNVGIGTANPGTTLEVNGISVFKSYIHITPATNTINSPYSTGIDVYNSGSGDCTLALRCNNTSTGSSYVSFDNAFQQGWCFGMDGSDSNKIKLAGVWNDLGNSTKLTVTTGGNVGIGVTNPGVKLDLPAASSYTPVIRIGTNTTYNDDQLYSLAWGGSTLMGMGLYSATQTVFGSQGLGLHIPHTEEFSVRTTGWAKVFALDGATNKAYFGGNVGIGTTSPAYKLDVSGTGRFTGTVTAPTFSGNATTATSASTLSGVTINNIFNNMGGTHTNRSDFNAIPDAGAYYVTGSTNGPGVNSASQYYGFTLGLGSDYSPVVNQSGKYGTQIYWGRNVTSPYINIRYLENGSWGGWQKAAAGWADSAGTATNQSGGTVSATTGSFSGNLTASGGITTNASQTRDKIRVWTTSDYTIGMESGYTFGPLNDYAMTFQMNNADNRGFWWGDSGHPNNQGAMALSTRGWLNVAERIKVGGGQADTSGASYPLHVVGESYYSSRMYLHQSGAGGGQNLFTGLEATTTANGRGQFVISSAYSDLVIASSQGNNNHGSTLSFTAYNPSNAGDYRKFVINQGNWGSRMQFLDFGYADATRANPHLYINSTDTVLTLDGINKRVGIRNINPGHNLSVIGNAYISSTLECDDRIYADNGCHVRGDWLRVDGQAGIYFNSYGGGWHMTDSTWIRAYNSKPVWVTDHVHVHQVDTGVATLSAYGDSQGTGRLYVGQSSTYGGGIEYNGDNSPASTGAGADYITLYRVDNGTYNWTARNLYNTNNWDFRGQVYAAGAFYTDGNRSVIRGGSPTLYFRDTDNYSAMLHNNSSLLYVLRGGVDTESWSQVNGQWPWIFNLSNNDSTCGGNLYVNGGNLYVGSRGIRSLTGEYGTVQTTGEGGNGWEGYSIDGRYVFMSDGGNYSGLYNDVDNHWHILCYRGAWVQLYYNNQVKLGTNNGGVTVTGTVTTSECLLTGAWAPGNYYRLMGYNADKQIQFSYNDGTSISDNGLIRFACGGSTGTGGVYTERVRITSGGNVGVNITNPTYKMHVNGSMYYSGGGNYGSDDRIKYNEQNVSNALTLISQLRPQKYEKIVEIPSSAEGQWIPTDEEWENVKNEYEYDDEYGFIAQDVRAIPELSFLVTGEETRTDTKIITTEDYSNLTTQEQNTYSLSYIKENITITPEEYSNLETEESNSYTVGYTKQVETDTPLGLNYNGIFVVAVAAIQELKAQLDAALARLDALENPPN